MADYKKKASSHHEACSCGDKPAHSHEMKSEKQEKVEQKVTKDAQQERKSAKA